MLLKATTICHFLSKLGFPHLSKDIQLGKIKKRKTAVVRFMAQKLKQNSANIPHMLKKFHSLAGSKAQRPATKIISPFAPATVNAYTLQAINAGSADGLAAVEASYGLRKFTPA